ncbi:MAG: hypothetical protein U0Q18_23385 [Bryobacteraceae bacterium]
MAYILRFVQHYRPADRGAFMELEAKFAELERCRDDFPKGRRLQPYAGREPAGTLIWESEFATLALAQGALALLEGSSEHEALFRQQAPYMLDAYTEIYEVLEL